MTTAPQIPAGTVGQFYDDQPGFIETASSASILSNTGTSVISSTGSNTFILGAPVAGNTKVIFKASTSTAVQTVNSGSTGVTFDGTNDDLTFDTAGETVLLKAISTSRWAVIVNTGSVGLS